MPTTPVYSWPYPSLTDPPNGPTLGSALALAAETTVKSIDDRVAGAETGVAALTAAGIYTARVTLAAPSSAITFSSIPTTLRRLVVSWTARGDTAATHALVQMRINNDAGANYTYEFAQFNTASLVANTGIAAVAARLGSAPAATTTAGIFGSGQININGWDRPHAQHLGFTYETQTMSSGLIYEVGGGTYTNPTSGTYTSLVLFTGGNFIAGSDFQLDGWR